MEDKVKLKEHNINVYEIIKESYKIKKHIGVVQATGTGKSYLIAKCIEDMNFENVLFLTSSKHIINEFKENFNFLINKINFMTYKKLSYIKNLKLFLEGTNYDFIVLDEYHRCGAKTWYTPVKCLLEFYKDTKILGVTATPVRYLDDARNMTEELFNSQPISEITLLNAIDNNILPAPKYVLSYFNIDDEIEKLKLKKMNDINDKDVLTNMGYIINNLELLSNVDSVIKDNLTNERKFIVFCSNVNHLFEALKIVPSWFKKIGFRTECYSIFKNAHNTRTNKELELELVKFKESKREEDKVTLLFVINILNEGVHIDEVDGLIFLRRTISPVILFQQLGRALKSSNKIPLIFDFVNNMRTFNFGQSGKNEKTHDRIATILKEYKLESTIEVIDYVQQIELLLEEIEKITLLSTWKGFVNSLKEYKRVNGDCNIPFKHPLYKKCARLRLKYKEGLIEEEKIKELSDLGFKWEVSIYDDDRWELMYQKLVDFKNEFGHVNVSRSYEDQILATWVQTQRKYKNIMSDERKQKLLDVGFEFELAKNKNQKEWEEMFEKLLKFKEENGHPNVSSRYKDKKLSNWVNTQRKSYKSNKLNEYRYKKLIDIGFVFSR